MLVCVYTDLHTNVLGLTDLHTNISGETDFHTDGTMQQYYWNTNHLGCPFRRLNKYKVFWFISPYGSEHLRLSWLHKR